MQHTCKNCSHKFKGNFCNSCGQSVKINRIDVHSAWHDIQHDIIHIDKGFFYTIYQLFSRPGDAIREFFDGKRVKHFKPITLLFILAGIYAFLYNYFEIQSSTYLTLNIVTTDNVNIGDKIVQWINNHYSLVTIFSLPLSAFATFLAFRKFGYNFIEFILLTAFIESQKFIVKIASFPLMYALINSGEGQVYTLILNLVYFALTLWTTFQFFNKTPKKTVFFRLLLRYLIFILIIVFIIIIITSYLYYFENIKTFDVKVHK